MSIPVKGLGSTSSVNSISAYSGGGGNSQTLERPKPTVRRRRIRRRTRKTLDRVGSCNWNRKTYIQLPSLHQVNIIQGSQTLGKTKKSKTGQRHSAGNIDYDNLIGGGGSMDYEDGCPSQQQHQQHQQHHQPTTTTFRSRSKTVGDSSGKSINCSKE